MRIHMLAWMGLLVVSAVSCRKHEEAARKGDTGDYRAWSKSWLSPQDETPVIYQIMVESDSARVRSAIFGDGSQIVSATKLSDDPAGNTLVTMEDRNTKEQWGLSIPNFDQVIVLPDRRVQKIPEFVRFEDDGLVFGNTDIPLLNAAAKAHAREQEE